MKTKILAMAIAATISSPLFAQQMTYDAGKTTLGIRAGVNLQNINGKDYTGHTLKNTVIPAFSGGINADIPLGAGAYVQPGVLYSMKGAKLENTEDKVHLSYVEVPVNFMYKPILGTGRMLLGFGPYAGFGIGGKVKRANGTDMNVEFTKTVNPTNTAPNTAYFKSFDAGGNLLVGYEFAQNLSFQLNAQLGMVNINPEVQGVSNDETKWRNTGFGLSLGYRF